LPGYWKAELGLSAAASAATFAPPAAAVTAVPTTAAAAALARNHRPCFVDNQRATHEVAAIAGFDGAIGRAVIVNFDEAEPASLASESVPHYVNAVYADPRLREEIRDIGFGCRIGQVPYEKFH
jgi:hypothetical protein